MNTTLAPPILDRLSALGDGTRTRILVLLERGEFTVSEVCAALQLPQPTVSRHLRKLAEERWVTHRAQGRNHHYRLAGGPDRASRELWRIVRAALGEGGVYARDAERAREVLAARHRRSAEFFARSATRWGPLRAELFGRRAEILPLFGLLDPAWSVGDLGTGTGGLAALLAPFVRLVVGVDRSLEMLDRARRSIQGFENVDLRTGTLEALPIEDGELDVAVLSLVLHYVAEPERALAEARRALRPGGRVVVVDMRAHDRGPEYAESMGHVWPGFEPATLLGWMEAAGFADTHHHPLPPDPEARGPLLFLATGRADGAPAAAHEPDIETEPDTLDERR